MFADESALDPPAEPEEIVARESHQARLVRLRNGAHEGYLPTTVSIYGPLGTGKTLTTRRVCRAFAARTEQFDFEYVDLQECRSLRCADELGTLEAGKRADLLVLDRNPLADISVLLDGDSLDRIMLDDEFVEDRL